MKLALDVKIKGWRVGAWRVVIGQLKSELQRRIDTNKFRIRVQHTRITYSLRLITLARPTAIVGPNYERMSVFPFMEREDGQQLPINTKINPRPEHCSYHRNIK